MMWKIEDCDNSTISNTCDKTFREIFESRPEGSVQCLDFDGIVKRHVKGDRPSSTDAVIRTVDSIIFVEFKGGDDPPSDGSNAEVPKSKTCGLKNKASDSVLVYTEFLEETLGTVDPKLVLIVVSNDGFGRIRGIIGTSAGRTSFCPDFLKKYMNRDLDGQRIFYDEVRWCSVDEFCSFIGELKFAEA